MIPHYTMTNTPHNKIISRLFLCVILAVAAFALTGCGASLTVYDYSSGGVRYNAFELSVDTDTVREMERTAATKSDGSKYTVENYFFELFEYYGYELASASLTDDKYTVRYVRAFDGETDLDRLGGKVDFTAEIISENPFTRDILLSAENPFNGLREKYDETSGTGTVLGQLKYGRVTVDEFGEKITVFPAVTDAFPALRGESLDGLLLGYARFASSRMKSSGVSSSTGGGNSEYMFSRYFDGTDTTIDFEYTRPVPYGWYLVALVVGGAVLAAILVVTREKKKKPTLLDRFPYDPEEYRDYESRLPTKR